MLLKFLKDPLLHFLVAGLVLFVAFRLINPDVGSGDDPKRIVVDREALLTFVQYRTKTFQPKLAAARLNALSDEQLKRLIDDYVREEALHREAKSLGLGRNDYIIKRRMIQKVDFITQGFADAAITISKEDLKAYYEANKQRYRVQAFITFTHVFFDAKRHGVAQAKAMAEEKLAEFGSGKVVFSDAPKHGERFPYGVNYVERTKEHVASHFGREMANALFALKPADGVWYGPLLSPYGAHLTMVVNRKDARTPPLEEVSTRITADLKRERRKEISEKAVKAIIDTYKVEIKLNGKLGKNRELLGKGN